MSVMLNSPSRVITALVPRPVVEGLQALAKSHDRSFSAEVRRALREHLEQQEIGRDAPPAPKGAA